MVYLVERYLPGVPCDRLVTALGALADASRQMRSEGTCVHYVCSTIVTADEACFCQFEGSSAAVVAELNRRAGLPFDRIVPALAVVATPGQKGEEP
jgi:Nickel responsive protein SCO4226-like